MVMKKYTSKTLLFNTIYLTILCFLTLTTFIRITNKEIFYVKFSLIPIINDNKLFWLWQFNNILTMFILIFVFFKKNNTIWAYLILEKIVFLCYFYFQNCQLGKCVSCEYNGTLSFLDNGTIIALNLFIIISATILFFSSYTPLYTSLFKLTEKNKQ